MGKTTPFNLHQPFEVSSLNPNKNQWFIHARKKLSKLSKPNQPSEQWKEGPWGCLGYKGIFSGNETNYTAYGKFWGIIFIIIPSFFADPKGFPSLYKQQPGYISMEIHIPPTGVVLFSRWLLQALFIRPQNPRLKRVDFLDSLGFAASRHHFLWAFPPPPCCSHGVRNKSWNKKPNLVYLWKHIRKCSSKVLDNIDIWNIIKTYLQHIKLVFKLIIRYLLFILVPELFFGISSSRQLFNYLPSTLNQLWKIFFFHGFFSAKKESPAKHS